MLSIMYCKRKQITIRDGHYTYHHNIINKKIILMPNNYYFQKRYIQNIPGIEIEYIILAYIRKFH